MLKTYKSSTSISVSVCLENGKPVFIPFETKTDGSSVYYTSDPDIQWALEHHARFGKLFRLTGASNTVVGANGTNKKQSGKKKTNTDHPKKPTSDPIPPQSEEENPKDSEEENDCEEGNEEYNEPKIILISDADAAKDYLSENFGIVRTKLKTQEAIDEAALSVGIIFKYQ